jgi:hypothetical protein
MENLQLDLLDSGLNEVKTSVDVLCLGVVFRLLCKSFGAGIVDVEGNESGRQELHFTE